MAVQCHRIYAFMDIGSLDHFNDFWGQKSSQNDDFWGQKSSFCYDCLPRNHYLGRFLGPEKSKKNLESIQTHLIIELL